MYQECLEHLNYFDDTEQSYNMVLSKNFMFIVLRKKDTYHSDGKSVGVNSLGYAGTHAVKREEDF